MTGDATEYSEVDEAGIYAAADRAWTDYGDGLPTAIRVTGRIEWQGEFDARRNGVRSVKLTDVDLTAAKEAHERARAAQEKVDNARVAESYKAQSWQAQLRKLTEHGRGSDAADKVGLDPSARQLTNWLSGKSEPRRSDQEKIAGAYEELRTWRLNEARDEAKDARKEFTDKLTGAIKDEYDTDVRFFDVTNIKFED